MGSQAPAKRPFCSSCMKPLRLCLCERIKNPSLDNKIAVTILRHNQERKHPLNSTRIATLGLKNLTIATDSDVHFEARFLIRVLEPCPKIARSPGYYPILESNATQTNLKWTDGSEELSDFERSPVTESEKQTAKIARSAEHSVVNAINGLHHYPGNLLQDHTVFEEGHESAIKSDGKQLGKQPCDKMTSTLPMVKETASDTQAAALNDQAKATTNEEAVITATIAKCGYTCSLTQLKAAQTRIEKPDFDKLLATQVGQDAISNGFVVKKLQKKPVNGSNELEEYEEFEIMVPPGSALLFPTKKSIGVEDVDFEVKHLIVLDGTWGKAKRMYHENPWLKLLPHLKLDSTNISLYSEVRHQPKAGCLSTIESIVSALKAFGDDHEGLDDLLTVFESMVRDQRRCKDERLSKISMEGES